MANEAPGYSRRSLARLAFSVAAAQLADRARARVPTTDDSWGRPGELLDEARALVVAAEELMEKALVCERERGASWTELGEVLGISKQGAQQKYGTLAEDWATAVEQATRPTASGLVAFCVPGEGGESPEEHAKRLDAWVLRHAEKHNAPRGKNPVSDGLERPSLIEQTSALARLARRMRAETDPAKQRVFRECKAAVLTRIAEADPTDINAAEAAEDARRELVSLPDPAEPPSARRKRTAPLRLVPKAGKPKGER